MKYTFLYLLITAVVLTSCVDKAADSYAETDTAKSETAINPNTYVSVKLTADLTDLTPNQREMLPILIEAADLMNDLFWYEAYGEKSTLLSGIDDPQVRHS